MSAPVHPEPEAAARASSPDGPDGTPAPLDRRGFLRVVGASARALPLAVAGPALAQMPMPMPMPGAAVQPTAPPPQPAYLFFNADEAAFIEAAVDTLIPADALGPGALECGVALYIDRQLGGAFGRGYRMYLRGPFVEGTPQQGSQSALTPADLVLTGVRDVDVWCGRHFKSNFASLAAADQAAVLLAIDAGGVELETVPARDFFNQLLALVIEGYFADPMYGANKDKSAWRMIGFPGAGAMYMDLIERYRNKPYPVDPQGIQDLS